jgi:murein DD-endopeptidase MepM/ murein hydrolase activator NlpD
MTPRPLHAAAWLLAASLTARPAPASPERAAAERLRARQTTLEGALAERDARARSGALAAYRLARRRALGAGGAAPQRLEETVATDAALLALGRHADEARRLRDELARVRADRAALEGALVATPDAAPAPDGDSETFLAAAVPPVRGTLVGAAGVREDPATGVTLRHAGVTILARANEEARAPAAGRVARVEPLPQGGWAVVVAHEGRWVSVLAGLREPRVTAGAEVAAGAPVGLVGRTLDGAPVVAFELWRARRPVDPRPLLERTSRRPLVERTSRRSLLERRSPRPLAPPRGGARPGGEVAP